MKIVMLGNFGVDYSSETHHKKSLESLGHEVIAMQEGEALSQTIMSVAATSQMFVWIHTHGWRTPGTVNMVEVLDRLKAIGIPTLTYHLDLWLGLERQKDLDNDPFYRHIQHFFTVDKLMADWFNDNTLVKGHYMPAGVFDQECVMLPPNGEPQNDVIFVGSKGYHPEWQWRPQLINWLHETYGDRFKHYGGDGLGVVRGMPLNQLYANTKVVVGDSLCLNFEYPYYWSDRVYETTGRGGFLLMPKIEGLDKQFVYNQQIGVFKFGDFADLKKNIDFYVKNDKYRETVRQAGFAQTKNRYTYKHRWAQILSELNLK